MKHSDWEVAAIASFTFAAGPAGRGGVFSFRNGSYATDPVYGGLTYDMLFIGAGFRASILARGLAESPRRSRRNRVAYLRNGIRSIAIKGSARWIWMALRADHQSHIGGRGYRVNLRRQYEREPVWRSIGQRTRNRLRGRRNRRRLGVRVLRLCRQNRNNPTHRIRIAARAHGIPVPGLLPSATFGR